ncbi:complexed with cef1p [Tieghemiomyces parasiticus]|uniref:Complexed with cef1p n=1 Tax=Tieghemiomyces parasiticus TaxID=78921 RepID=A0A9W7ZUE1_9FUNG|nr:complexed with cef1p [Tieghemiomyces parasiticus]
MTTAARPTFDPARGRESQAPTVQLSARDLASHTKLKFRQPGQDDNVALQAQDLKRQLLEAEREHFRKKQSERSALGNETATKSDSIVDSQHQPPVLDEERRRQLLAQVQAWDNDDDDDSDDDNSEDENAAHKAKSQPSSASAAEEESDDDDDDDSDDEDDTAQLLRELEKIKRERAEEEARKVRQRTQLEESQQTEQLLGGNPLLNLGGERQFTVKRRWDDDVVFKNQARDVDDKPQKRFINDMLRSDFHRKFMNKYIR